MYAIKAPNKNFIGERYGVKFYNGEAEPKQLTVRQYDWFTSHGYKVDGERPKETKPKE